MLSISYGRYKESLISLHSEIEMEEYWKQRWDTSCIGKSDVKECYYFYNLNAQKQFRKIEKLFLRVPKFIK